MSDDLRDPNKAVDYILAHALFGEGSLLSKKVQYTYPKASVKGKITKPHSADNTMRLLSNQPVQEVFMPDSDFNPIHRPCIKCGASNRTTNGQCRPCSAIRAAAWRANNPEKAGELRNKWKSENPEKVRASTDKWNAANLEKVRAARTARYAANPKKERLSNSAWRAANKSKSDAYNKQWNIDNPESSRRKNHARRARKNAAGGMLSKGITAKLFALQRGQCPCCKQPLGDNYHLDHTTPLMLGGANSDDNVQLLRAECNLKKSAKHPVAYMQEKGFLL